MTMKTKILTALGFFAALSLSTTALAAGDIAAGEKKSVVCASCHGPDGNSTVPTFPKLAGQYADYIEQALKDYRSGARKDAVMSSFVTRLSDQDIEDIAAYFHSRPGSLFTPTDY